MLVSNNFRIFAVRFCVSYIKIQKNWFILVHFTKSLFLFFFVAYRAASILALASSTSEFFDRIEIDLRGAFSIFRLVATFVMMAELPLNEQRETTSLRSFPFVRCIHSDYIT